MELQGCAKEDCSWVLFTFRAVSTGKTKQTKTKPPGFIVGMCRKTVKCSEERLYVAQVGT